MPFALFAPRSQPQPGRPRRAKACADLRAAFPGNEAIWTQRAATIMVQMILSSSDRLTSWRREERLELPTPTPVGLAISTGELAVLLPLVAARTHRMGASETGALASIGSGPTEQAPIVTRDRHQQSFGAGAFAPSLHGGSHRTCVFPRGTGQHLPESLDSYSTVADFHAVGTTD